MHRTTFILLCLINSGWLNSVCCINRELRVVHNNTILCREPKIRVIRGSPVLSLIQLYNDPIVIDCVEGAHCKRGSDCGTYGECPDPRDAKGYLAIGHTILPY